jgi:hypothetical protein
MALSLIYLIVLSSSNRHAPFGDLLFLYTYTNVRIRSTQITLCAAQRQFGSCENLENAKQRF